ncbi:MAG: hypothetical protein R2838_13515 [Caldilineaceae bacterium]
MAVMASDWASTPTWRLIWAAFGIGSSIGMGVLVYVAVGLLPPEETEEDVVRARMEAQDVQVVDGLRSAAFVGQTVTKVHRCGSIDGRYYGTIITRRSPYFVAAT